MLRTFLQWTSMILTLEASYFLVRVNLGLSPKVIAELGTPYLDYHEETIKSLANQYIDTRIGLFLLLLSFVLQIANTLWPLSWVDPIADRNGVVASILFCIIVGVIALLCSRLYSKRIFNRSMQIIKDRDKKR